MTMAHYECFSSLLTYWHIDIVYSKTDNLFETTYWKCNSCRCRFKQRLKRQRCGRWQMMLADSGVKRSRRYITFIYQMKKLNASLMCSNFGFSHWGRHGVNSGRTHVHFCREHLPLLARFTSWRTWEKAKSFRIKRPRWGGERARTMSRALGGLIKQHYVRYGRNCVCVCDRLLALIDSGPALSMARVAAPGDNSLAWHFDDCKDYGRTRVARPTDRPTRRHSPGRTLRIAAA